ncbi:MULTISPECIES: endonuclease/exonuclease/phosphatase family protein [unclassified Yoonia]|uniref:endonuclease/exonuclease/phosphatase family protein n=1 Tax=unclassified Yoonia TaxID=2629118 RepID=UPI002AFE827E|nr:MULTISPECIES: endonuclease/exonuclease/phosphatase family protein [unclassified Yoonia]
MVADGLRIATYAAPLGRDGPGMLLRDLMRGDDPQIAAILAVIRRTDADVLLLTDFDYDLDGLALAAFAALVDPPYPHHFALRPNSGMPTGLDMDRNGRLGEARDAQGYGRFSGDSGMALLSRLPIDPGGVTDLSALLWRDLPGGVLPVLDGQPFLTDAMLDVQRLSTTGHWVVPVLPPDAPPFAIMAFAATPPAFDGPERRNVLRNRDELRLWEHVLDGQFGPLPDDFVIAGNANLDPFAGRGETAAMAAFLAHPLLQDPLPDLPTADWTELGIGKLRVSYVLPSRGWEVVDADVDWPMSEGDSGSAGVHHLVWVDIRRARGLQDGLQIGRAEIGQQPGEFAAADLMRHGVKIPHFAQFAGKRPER